jgi:hypothetical protein
MAVAEVVDTFTHAGEPPRRLSSCESGGPA